MTPVRRYRRRARISATLWDWHARHAAPPTDDDTPILIGSGGRRATREEIIAVLAEAEARGEAERG